MASAWNLIRWLFVTINFYTCSALPLLRADETTSYFTMPLKPNDKVQEMLNMRNEALSKTMQPISNYSPLYGQSYFNFNQQIAQKNVPSPDIIYHPYNMSVNAHKPKTGKDVLCRRLHMC
uniref:Uncharacterized protein n=1 Tax=Panagrellus redivivus TaxID=6233 RepID=A0A7E4V2D2_PANRE